MDLYLCTDSSVCVYESPTDTYASHTMYTTAEKHTPGKITGHTPPQKKRRRVRISEIRDADDERNKYPYR